MAITAAHRANCAPLENPVRPASSWAESAFRFLLSLGTAAAIGRRGRPGPHRHAVMKMKAVWNARALTTAIIKFSW